MARTAEQNRKLISDWLAAFKAANPGVTYPVSANYLPGGWVSISQDGHRTTHRPSKVEAMIERLRERAAFLEGFADASALHQRMNTYPDGSKCAEKYELGYSRSMQENG